MIRLVISDDHALVRDGLKRILALERDIEIVGEACDGNEAVELVRQRRPDVILLDISMPQKDGIEATQEITKLSGRTKVLILTIHADLHYALRAMRAGAQGFLSKQAKSAELIHAIHQVYANRRYLPTDLESSFAERYVHNGSSRSPIENLSDRELQVMCLLSQGLSNREIANQLHISIKTVDSHRRNLLHKLQVRNNADLTRLAIQYKLLDQ
ncbi:MAG: hypothetical protein A2Z21_05140 [Candidatus Fraserbacteria bacterium RBG_16_55_9]|uniref:DNA-binding response regulator n=1 Tax=Fraserbacteria sp. (strain RBG_16_55_9) TaxID=1817864 RepID=A0A1F5US41_FRAXR|nr:MAG: hypothetical protein A2Z21_05140 [Candidatus Fraserbacteria bacterium RBG_16_55_9]